MPKNHQLAHPTQPNPRLSASSQHAHPRPLPDRHTLATDQPQSVYRAVLPAPGHLPAPPAPPIRRLPQRPRPKKSIGLLVWGLGGLLVVVITSMSIVMLGIHSIYSAGILPGVYMGDLSLGGMDITQATDAIQQSWQTVTLIDETQQWQINPTLLGITLDASATAENAYAMGRTTANGLQAILGEQQVLPVMAMDMAIARLELERIAPDVSTSPKNARIGWVNQELVALPSEYGRQLDIDATLEAWQTALPTSIGTLVLRMQAVAPEIVDASPLLAQAQAILLSPLDIRIFDPVTGDSVYWSVQPQQWNAWVEVLPDQSNPSGIILRADERHIRDYLNQQAGTHLDASRTLALDAGVASVRDAIALGDTDGALVSIKHRERYHVVQRGESITSIAWDYGMPYPYIQEANGNLQSVSIGQTITIPPADSFLLKPVIPDKRIVVSISQQRTWVYQDGQMIREWASSTGIADSPTWQGVYQIISHERNAYAGNWDLWMPYFMGVYQPIPNSAFTNGFHGFPTRGGGQLLWENSLGTRVTYGCILLSNTNASWLYDWAQEGVVVEIRG